MLTGLLVFGRGDQGGAGTVSSVADRIRRLAERAPSEPNPLTSSLLRCVSMLPTLGACRRRVSRTRLTFPLPIASLFHFRSPHLAAAGQDGARRCARPQLEVGLRGDRGSTLRVGQRQT